LGVFTGASRINFTRAGANFKKFQKISFFRKRRNDAQRATTTRNNDEALFGRDKYASL
jgi:hypothetical protein